MRKIKFRGQSLYTTHEIQFGSLLVVGEKKYIIPDKERIQLLEHRVIPETVGQFTGLLDKNGVEIYENDIVTYKCTYPYDKDHVLYDKLYKAYISFENGSFFIPFSDTSTLEVIGNIHDNQELLQ